MSRSLKTILAVTALLLAVLATLWMSVSNTARFTFKDIAFDIRSPELVTVTLDVTRNVDDTVECAARVLSEQKAIVGWKAVTFGPGEATAGSTTTPRPGQDAIVTGARSGNQVTERGIVQVRTNYQGVSGGVANCWVIEK